MATAKPPSKSVFVGNIPYGLSEEQITEIFSSAGKVVSFRLVYDRETGRPKGFGFAEYPDADSAASAVRNINDYEIMNRKLRVDFSNDGVDDESAAPPGYQHQGFPSNGTNIPVPPQMMASNSTLPSLPVGVELPPGLTCPDAISRTLNTLPPSQLLDVLSQMKSLVSSDPAKATQLLSQAPQLSYALFQALLLMGLVSTNALTSVVEQAAAAPPAVPSIQTQAPTPQHYGVAAPVHQGFPPGFQPNVQQTSTPPIRSQPYPPPPPPPQQQQQQQQQQQSQVAPGQGQPDTAALMQQVMAMPQELIDQLQPADRDQILALRAQFMQGR